MSIDFNNTEIAFAHKSDKELRDAYQLFKAMNIPALVNLGSSITAWALNKGFPIETPVRLTIFNQFCGGRNIEECKSHIEDLSKHGIRTILDYGVEGKQDEAALDETAKYLTETLEYAKSEPGVNILSIKITGLFPDELLVKFGKEAAFTEDEQAQWQRGKDRVSRICSAAYDSDIQLYFDAEESWVQEAIDALVMEQMEEFNKHKSIVFNTIQLYRHDRLAYLKSSFEKAQTGRYILAVKLVRGAYMEKERIRAKSENRPSPIQASKEATDNDYNEALRFCMEHLSRINFCNATHNEDSCRLLTELVQAADIPNDHPHILTAQLYGMGENLSFNMAKEGLAVAKYMPYGPVREVVPYLIRRAQENTSADGTMSRELNLLKKEMKRRGL